VVSNARIEKAGFRAEIAIETGIRELIKAYAVVRRRGYGNA